MIPVPVSVGGPAEDFLSTNVSASQRLGFYLNKLSVTVGCDLLGENWRFSIKGFF